MAGSGIDYNRLHQAVQASRRILRLPRQNMTDLVREASGHRYGNASADRITKLNLLGLYQDVVAPMLVSSEPRYYVTTDDQQARPGVRIEQDWLNEQTVHINLAEVGREVVTNALYATGIMQVSLASPCDAAVQAWGITAGEPICASIDLDDWCYDPAAKRFGFASFMGKRYRCPVSVAKKMYGRAAKDLVEEEPQQFNREGDERIDRILKGSYAVEEFEPHVELWEIYLPRHGLVVTLSDQDVKQADKNGNARPLWEQKWIGPPTGPYLFLRFATVPGQALARAPMMDLYEPHMDANNVHRKINQTLRDLKELTIYGRNQEHDATAMKKARHGDFCPVDNPDKIKSVVTAGAALQGLFTAAEVYKNLFSYRGGNIEVLGGRSPQTRTVGQEKILNANAGGGIANLHGEVAKLMAQAGENLLWYAHSHPQLVMRSEYKAPGSKGQLRLLHPPGSGLHPSRDWPFSRAKLRVDPYSLRRREPEERLAFVQGVLGLLTPMLPLLAQQGVALDANALINVFAELGDSPELSDLFTAAPPMAQQGPQGAHERTMPGNTSREYTRNSGPQQQDKPGQAVAEMSPQDFGGQPQAAA